MRKRLVLVTTVVLLTLLVSTVASAQSGIPGSGWWSGEQVQNVSAGDAHIELTAYQKDTGTAYATQQVTVPAGGSTNFNPSSFTGMGSGFQGSGVVSSDQPIKAIVNVTNQLNGTWGVAGGKAAAQYQGTENPDTTLYFPMVKNNRYGNTTAFYIQNAGGSAASVTATFRMGQNNDQIYTYTTPAIQPNLMVVIMPSQAKNAGGTPLPNTDGNRANIGSMSVTSSQPLAGTVMEFKQAEAVATVLAGTRGFTAADFDTKAYAPTVKRNRYGRVTGIQVQNVDTTKTLNIKITYVGSAKNNAACLNQTFTDSFNGIPLNGSHTFNQMAGQTNFVNNCTGAATIESTNGAKFVAVVNEINDGTTGAGQLGAAIEYYAIPDHTTTTKVVLPQFKDQRYGFSTGLMIQNVGAVQANNVVATFVCKGQNSANTPFTAISKAQIVPPGGAKQFLKPSTTPGDFTTANAFKYNGAACGVTVTSDQKIVAIANETPDTAGALDDNNYEGFNVTP